MKTVRMMARSLEIKQAIWDWAGGGSVCGHDFGTVGYQFYGRQSPQHEFTGDTTMWLWELDEEGARTLLNYLEHETDRGSVRARNMLKQAMKQSGLEVAA